MSLIVTCWHSDIREIILSFSRGKFEAIACLFQAVLALTFCGKKKVKLALKSSSSCEVLLQKLSDTGRY